MRPITQLDSKVVHREDVERFLREFVQGYWLQPLAARKLAGASRTMTVSADDPRREYAITVLDNVDYPVYARDPVEETTDLSGRIKRIYAYQLSKTVEFGEDEYHQLFAGRGRVPLIVDQLRAMFAQAEDIIAFRGDSNMGVKGLISDETHDMGSPSGSWGAATNGVLQNVITDIRAVIDHFNAQGYPDAPIDMVVTQPIAAVLQTTFMAPYSSDNNYTLVQRMLRGGTIYVTNNIQEAAADETHNTALFVLRRPEAFRLDVSNIEVLAPKKYGNIWQYKMGMRETFGIGILTPDMIAYYDEISVAP